MYEIPETRRGLMIQLNRIEKLFTKEMMRRNIDRLEGVNHDR